MYSNTSAEATHTDAAVAQSVERRIGSAEVTGPIPVSSSARKERKPLIYKGFRFFYSLLAIHSSCAIMIRFAIFCAMVLQCYGIMTNVL